MCGGEYVQWEKPRQLTELAGEAIVARTIRLLKECGVEDIAISSNRIEFAEFGVELLRHTNKYVGYGKSNNGLWTDAFYLMDEPVCYLFGDVVFSPEAIKTIVETKTEDIEFFASAPPFSPMYTKRWAEPFALKVVNTEHLKSAIAKVKELHSQGKFSRNPIMWELWQVIKDTPINKLIYDNYTAINDYTCDIDSEEDIKKFKQIIRGKNISKYMIHAMPKRMWYVNDYLIPSMVAQGISRENIQVYNDEKKDGNLRAWINSTELLQDDNEGTWHLQDDVIISHNFKEVTELLDYGIVCGFKSMYDGENPFGPVVFSQSWFSFLCIRIPNKIAKECAEWIDTYMIGNPVYRDYWKDGVNDDWMFRQFINTKYPHILAINLKPNIVDHIDYLIGGTVNSNKRTTQIRAKYWEDEQLVHELASRLKEKNNG